MRKFAGKKVNVKVDLDRDLYYGGECVNASISGTKLDGTMLGPESTFSYSAMVFKTLSLFKS